ncbi:MAG: hypothetical protein AAB288_13640 [Acidobacteriota bacterium]
MVKRTRTAIAREIDKPKSVHTSAIRPNPKEKLSADDLIVTLSDAHENRRARQVVEWQSLQASNVQRAI